MQSVIFYSIVCNIVEVKTSRASRPQSAIGDHAPRATSVMSHKSELDEVTTAVLLVAKGKIQAAKLSEKEKPKDYYIDR